MTQDEAPALNPNTADEEQLRQLPGVGPQLAGRIIEGRPYERLEDMRSVSGLGDKALESLKTYLIFEMPRPPAEPEPAEPAEDTARPLKYPIVPTQPQSTAVSLWALLAVGAASLVCSVTLTLAILAGINGTLDYGRHAALRESRSELIQIRSELEAIQVETEALRARSEVLAGVSGRMAEVETQVSALEAQIGETIHSVDAMQAELAVALQETRAQAERVNRFQSFLDGLRRLVGQAITEP